MSSYLADSNQYATEHDNCPVFLERYLEYLQTNLRKRPLTVVEAMLVLREFCQYIHYRNTNEDIPPSGNEHKRIDIVEMKPSELSRLKQCDLEEYLFFLEEVANNSTSTVRKKVSNFMGNCQCCDRDMREAYGCTYHPIIHHGKKYPPIKVGDPGDFYFEREKSRCGDCGAVTGHYHHIGCDLERCPVCGGQLISCGCNDAGQRYRPLWTDVLRLQSEVEVQAQRNLIPIILQEGEKREPADLWFRYILMKVAGFKEAYAIYQITKVTKTYCDVTAVFISGMDHEVVRAKFPHFRYDHIVPEWGMNHRLRRSHVQNLLKAQDSQTWSNIKAELHQRSKLLRVIETFNDAQLTAKGSKFARICPRCGEYAMDEDPVRNALSRHVDVYICDKCGTDEAVRDWNQAPLPLEEWACDAMKE